MWQSAVFRANLNDDRENAARSFASNAQVLRVLGLEPANILNVVLESAIIPSGWWKRPTGGVFAPAAQPEEARRRERRRCGCESLPRAPAFACRVGAQSAMEGLVV